MSLYSGSEVHSEEWGSMTWLVDTSIVPNAALSLARMTVRAGAVTAAHRHGNCAEVIHVLTGRIDWWLDGERHAMQAGDTLYIAPGTVHHGHNAGDEEAVMMISYSTGKREFEAVDLP